MGHPAGSGLFSLYLVLAVHSARTKKSTRARCTGSHPLKIAEGGAASFISRSRETKTYAWASPQPLKIFRPEPSPQLLYSRRKYLFHGQIRFAARAGIELVAAVGPNGVGNTAVGHEAFIVTLLIAVVYGGAGKHTIAVVFVGTDSGHTGIRRPRHPSIARLREISVGLEALAGGVIPGVVERYIHVTRDRIDRKPMVETVNRKRQLIGDRFFCAPGCTLIVGEGKEDIGIQAIRG